MGLNVVVMTLFSYLCKTDRSFPRVAGGGLWVASGSVAKIVEVDWTSPEEMTSLNSISSPKKALLLLYIGCFANLYHVCHLYGVARIN